jgi:transcriptional regulator with XRE-family HTH domain
VPNTIHTGRYQALLQMLRERRLKLGLSQTEVANRLGWGQTTVSKVEVGERRIDVEELRQLCEALEIDFVKFVRQWLRANDDQ